MRLPAHGADIHIANIAGVGNSRSVRLMKGRRDCEQCATVYFQPFDRQPLRFLWWVDDALHKLHAPRIGPVRWLCSYLDRKLGA